MARAMRRFTIEGVWPAGGYWTLALGLQTPKAIEQVALDHSGAANRSPKALQDQAIPPERILLGNALVFLLSFLGFACHS